jgi:hypothetical protein
MISHFQLSFRRSSRWWFAGLLIAVTLAVYGSSLHFGLIWDDPLYYQRVLMQSSLWQIMTSPQPPTFQFYRPLAVLLAHLVVSPAGIVNAPLAHWIQISAHLLATLAVAPVLQAFRLRLAHARLAALFFALCPLSYYGVAWQQNQQPLVLMAVLISLLAADRFCRRGAVLGLGLSLLAYAAALLIQEGAAPFVVAFVWLGIAARRANTPRYWRWWPLLHLGITALYAVVWLSLPLQRGVTGQGFQPVVLAYLEQGLVFPLAWALSSWASTLSTWGLIGLFAALWAILSLGTWRWTSLRAALLGNVWVGAGLLPLWAGLSWEYAQNGARLVYPAAFGAAVVWGGWMALAITGRGWKQLLGAIVALGVAATSLVQLEQSRQIYQAGTQHLAQAVKLLSAEAASGQRLLFVNFPDRLELRPRPYPLGFWGIYLAPVIQNLSDYALAETGQTADSSSLSASLIGTGDRGAWPYRVDMRGTDTPPADFFDAARSFDRVYLTDYLPGGSLRLSEVGSIRASDPALRPLARLGNDVELMQADVLPGGGLRLLWRCLKTPAPGDTVFVHLWRGEDFVASADGDSLGGLLAPPTWRPGADILDIRAVDYGSLGPGTYALRVGLYSRATGVRYPAFTADGAALSNDEVPVGSTTR